jgi:UDP-N-acetyl-2-amino-2-deoxyglucuronate dehydrogenase
MQKIKIGVCGCGHIGKRHVTMILGNPAYELLALCDILPAEDLKLDLSCAQIPFYPSLGVLLKSHPEIELICLATPNGLHEPQALQVLEAGKHVLVEKPLALSKAACEHILFKALEKNRQVFCVMQNRYSPPSQWLKQLVESGVLGTIYMVQVNCFWNRDERYYQPGNWHGTKDLDGGTLFTQFSHFIDLLYWCFGDLYDIEARLTDFAHRDSTEFEDSGMVNFRLKEGTLGSLSFTTAVWDANFESSLTVIAQNGTLKIGGQYMNKVEYCHLKNYQMPELPPANPPNNYGAYQGSAANHHFVFQNIVEVLQGREAISTNALEGLKVVEIIERIYQAGKQNNALKPS